MMSAYRHISPYKHLLPTERIWLELRDQLGRRLKTMWGKQRHQTLTAWGHRYFPHYFTERPSEQHLWLGSKLREISTKRDARIVAIGPRGSAKSTYTTFLYPLAGACEGFEKYIILVADTFPQACKYLKAIRAELEDNVDLARAFPDACGAGPVWNDNVLVTRNGVCIEAIGSGSKIRGRRFGQHRPTAICVDDPDGDEAAHSALSRERIWDWFVNGVLNAGAPGTNYILAGTMIHRDCTVGRAEKMAGWETGKFASIVEWPLNMDLWDEWEGFFADISNQDREKAAHEFYLANRVKMEEGSRVLWKEREPLYDLMKKMVNGGKAAFMAEKQNRPFDPSKVEWDISCFEGDDVWFDDWPKDMDCKVMALDPSKGKSDKTGDFQAICMLGIKHGVMYMDFDMQRRPIRQLVEDFVTLSKIFQPDIAIIEENQFQECILGEVEDESLLRKILVPIEGMGNYAVAKVTRIRRLGPYWTRRRIKLKKRSRGVLIARDQFIDFPNGLHDDGPDAAEMAVRRAGQLLASANERNPENPY